MLRNVKKEARTFTRVRFATRAEVDAHGVTLHGDVIDMSMSGIYMRSSATVSLDDNCEVRILLGNDSPMVIHALGHVARCDANGFAVTFSGFYCDSDSCLKQVILYNTDNRDAVEKEIERAPKLAVIDK